MSGSQRLWHPLSRAWLLSILIVMAGCATQKPPSAPVDPSQTSAGKMIKVGGEHVEKFLGYSQAEGLRNMLGGARGIFIAPDMGGGSFIAGLNKGSGFLMRRHGDAWSDPVFFDLTETSAGFQMGVKQSDVIVLLMTDTAVNNFINGSMRVGGSGGITLGIVGLSVTGAGGVDGGLELLIISSSQGVSFGGAVSTIDSKLDGVLNSQAYGAVTDAQAILGASGGKYAPAAKLRQDLTGMVRHAWGVGSSQ